MRPSCLRLSGGRYPFPKHVWTPTGGWWHTPANYKQNSAIIFSAFFASLGVLYYYGEKLTVEVKSEYDTETIDRWNEAAGKYRKGERVQWVPKE